MDPISKFMVALLEDLIVLCLALGGWAIILHLLHDFIRGKNKRTDEGGAFMAFALGAGIIFGAVATLWYYIKLKAEAGGFGTPLVLHLFFT